MTSNTTNEQIDQLLRSKGRRLSPGMRKLVSALRELGKPATIPDLLRLKPGALSQSSVYRQLSILKELGIVTTGGVAGVDHAMWALVDDMPTCPCCHQPLIEKPEEVPGGDR